MADLVTRRVIEIDTRIAAGALANLKSVDSSLGSIEKTISSTGSLMKQFAVGLASAFTVGAFVQGIRGAIDSMDQLNKEIQKAGVGADTYQKLRYAADLAGVGYEALTKSLGKLSVAMQDVDKGSTAAGKALQSLGVTSKDTADSAFYKIADAFAAMPDGARKSALAIEIFGKAGQDLIPILNEGAEGLKRLGLEAEDLGIIFSQATLAAAGEFNDTLTKIKAVAQGAFGQIAEGLLPALRAVSDAFLDVVKSGTAFVGIGEGIGTLALWIAEQFIKASATVEAFGKLLGGLAAASSAVLTGQARQAGRIIKDVFTDIDQIGDQANKRIADLRARFEKYKDEQAQPNKTQSGGGTVEVISGQLEDWEKELDRLGTATKQATEELRLLGAGFPVNEAKAMAEQVAKFNDALLGEYGPVEGKKRIDELGQALGQFLLAQKAVTDEINKQALAAKRQQEIEKVAQAQRLANMEQVAKGIFEERKQLDDWNEQAADLADPARHIRAELDALNQAYDEGRISVETYSQVQEKLSHDLVTVGDSLSNLNDDAHKFHEEFVQAISRASEAASAALVDFATGAEGNFQEMFTTILKQFATFIVQMKIMQPLFQAALGGLEGYASGFFKSAKGSAFDQGGNVIPFARGGVVQTPTLFAFAQGTGLMGEAGPEAIMPLARTTRGDLGVKSAGGGSSGTNVYVINNARGAKAQTTQQKRPDGGVDIKVMVEDAVDQAFGSGRFDTTMQGIYGLRRVGRN